jgi:hypothetical protein
MADRLQLSVSAQTLRRFYRLVFAANSVFIIVTGASDLGVPLAHWGIFLPFDLKMEGNAAVWYSSSLLLLTGLAALAISVHVPPQITSPRQYRWIWTLGALSFLSLSVDETAQLHELAGHIFTKRVGDVPGLTPGAGAPFAWLVALAPLIIGFLLVMRMAVQWLRLYPRSRRFALAGCACWIGVLLAEFIQAQLRRLSMERSIQGVIEEGLEITGSTLFLISFLEFLRHVQRSAVPDRSEMPYHHSASETPA